jgi:hypothetical protein
VGWKDPLKSWDGWTSAQMRRFHYGPVGQSKSVGGPSGEDAGVNEMRGGLVGGGMFWFLVEGSSGKQFSEVFPAFGNGF